jgi:hypothetical protein
MNTIINATQKQVAAWAVERPQITEEDHTGVTDTLDRLTKWLEEKEAKQATLESHETPAFTSRDVAYELEPLNTQVLTALRKRVPEPVGRHAPPPSKKKKGGKKGGKKGEKEGEEKEGEEKEGEKEGEETEGEEKVEGEEKKEKKEGEETEGEEAGDDAKKEGEAEEAAEEAAEGDDEKNSEETKKDEL